ncbi:hypothetical protein GGR54DRAFT_611315 [Hypoxylon sp. NC1633]|nr:hypothetical protein GGR54DRAFT_611315 [Hypoxylon sp. NC1633]
MNSPMPQKPRSVDLAPRLFVVAAAAAAVLNVNPTAQPAQQLRSSLTPLLAEKSHRPTTSWLASSLTGREMARSFS